MPTNNEFPRPVVREDDIKFGKGILTELNEIVDLPVAAKMASSMIIEWRGKFEVVSGYGIDVYEHNLAMHGIFLLKRSEAAPVQPIKSEELEQL